MSPSIRALLVEDDFDLATTIADYAALEGIDCNHAYNGAAGLELARGQTYDVILLDLGLPRLDGLQVCDRLRQEGVDTPVLMLTARDTLEDKIAGFRAGTDDYLVKPFAAPELIVRIRALARRRSGQARRLALDDLVMDLDRKQAWRAGHELRLSPILWQLLETLMRHSPCVVSRRELETSVWQDDPPGSDSLKVHLHKLRAVVDKPFDQPMIHTIAGQGVAARSQG